MTDEELRARLKALCANWRKTAAEFRGKGFAIGHALAVEWRRGKADGLEKCAEELSQAMRKDIRDKR